MNEKIDFSKRFVSALDNAGFSTLSNAKLGKIFGVSAPMITHYRHGEKLPSVDTLIRIANKCKVSVIWLVQGMGEMNLEDVQNHHVNVQEPLSTYKPPSIETAICQAKNIRNAFFHKNGEYLDQQEIDPELLIAILSEYINKQLSAKEVLTILSNSLKNDIFRKMTPLQVMQYWKKEIAATLSISVNELDNLSGFSSTVTETVSQSNN